MHPQTCRSSTSSPSGIGIDKLALSLPVSGIVQDRQVWDKVYSRWAQVHEYLTMNTSLHIAARQVGPGLRCIIEYNPARLIDPCGWSLCSVQEALGTVPRVVSQLQGRVEGVGSVEDILITRLDVARDFTVADPQFFLTGLRPLHRRNGKNPSLWFDEVSGAASSLRVGTSWAVNARRPNHVTLYDKHLKTATEDSRGILRWELSARTWVERFGEIKTLPDLTPERVERLALDRWEWSRMGEVVASRNEVVHSVYAAGWLSENDRIKFLGQHFAILAGERVLHGKAREKFNRIQRRLSLTASDRPGLARRLDFVTGTDVPGMSGTS